MFVWNHFFPKICPLTLPLLANPKRDLCPFKYQVSKRPGPENIYLWLTHHRRTLILLIRNEFARIPAFMQEFRWFCRSFLGIRRNWNCFTKKRNLLQGAKRGARQQQLRNARWMQVDYCCTCSVVLSYSRVCSQPSAFTLRSWCNWRGSCVAAKYLKKKA